MNLLCINLQRKLVLFALFGIGLILISMIISLLLPFAIDYGVKNFQQIKVGSEFYSNWLKLPVPILHSIYIFEVINPSEILAGKKPILRERGPYIYREYREKKIISFSEDKTLVKYWNVKTYIHDPELGENIDEELTLLNVPMLSIASFIEKLASNDMLLGGVLYGVINTLFAFHNTNLFLRTTPRKFLFEGIKVKELDVLEALSLPAILFGLIKKPPKLPNNKFSMFVGRNGTYEGIHEVYTGVGKSWKNFSLARSFKGKKSLRNWRGKYCNMINGTDGVQFRGRLTTDEQLYVFIPDICRSNLLVFDKEVKWNGINAYRFRLDSKMFEGIRSNEANRCYCLHPSEIDKCSTNGILEISPCAFGSPIFISNPHFIGAERKIANGVIGLNPNPESHLTFMEIEPTAGIPLNVAQRIQFNVRLKRLPLIGKLNNVQRDVIVPLIWMNGEVQLDETNKNKIKLRLVYPLMFINVLVKALFIIGVLILFFTLKKALLIYKQKTKIQNLKNIGI